MVVCRQFGLNIVNKSTVRHFDYSTCSNILESKLLRTKHLLKYNKLSSDIASQDSKQNIQRLKSKSSVYIHWPFCRRKCTYCNFNKYVAKKVDNERMIASILQEWETVSRETGVNQPTSIFFGGGTPSLMQHKDIRQIISQISGGSDIEISLEANPSDILETALEFKQAGVNRLSLGIQSFQDTTLQFFNRDHDAETGRRSLETCLNVFGSRRVSGDLIFGVPGQTVQDWLQELRVLVSLGVHHISTYQLTVERGTLLHKQVKTGSARLPGEDELADLYLAGVQLLTSEGFNRYEVSSFAKEGAECSHNISYWRGHQYIGLGPGAHSRVGFGAEREARINVLAPGRWMNQVESTGDGIVQRRKLDLLECLGELITTGLRRSVGINGNDWNTLSQNLLPFQDLISELNRVQEDKERSGELEGLAWSQDGVWLDNSALNIADHIIPNLYYVLQDLIKLK